MNQTITSRRAPQVVNPFDLNRRVLASDLSLSAKAVLLIVLDHARHGQSTCTASTRTIAKEARITERHVRNMLRELELRGLITILRATGSRHSRHTIMVADCMHQVGTEFRYQFQVVGTEFREVGNPAPGAGDLHPYSSKEKNSEKDGFSLPEEEIDPWTRRWFGVPPTDTTGQVGL